LAFREALRYWAREVLGGSRHRRALRASGIDVSSVSLRRLGLDPRVAHNHAYSGGPDLERVLRDLAIGPDSAILDLGCGKGGALLTFAGFPFGRIVGLDLSREMLAAARSNLARAGHDRVELLEGDACAFADYDGFTHVYMYNPFPREVMRRALDAMEASLGRRPRHLTVIYKNPRFHDEVVRNGVLKERKRYAHSGHPFVVYEG
jgi:SAM-dependent methyltransferase